MNIIPVGGKTPSNTAAAVAVDANGKLDTVKTWGFSEEALVVGSSSWITPSTTAKYTNALDVSDCAMISLCVMSATKNSSSVAVPVTFTFLRTDSESSTELMRDADGNYISFTLGNGYHLITPDDFPILKYLKYLHLRIVSSESVSSGQVNVKVYRKR